MTDQQAPWWKQAAAEVSRNKWAQLAAFLFIAFEIYNTAILPAYLNTQKARIELEAANNAAKLKAAEAAKMEAEAQTAKAEADAAKLRKDSDAKLAEQKAAIEIETARVAAKLKAAEAAKMEAEAKTASAEADAAKLRKDSEAKLADQTAKASKSLNDMGDRRYGSDGQRPNESATEYAVRVMREKRNANR